MKFHMWKSQISRGLTISMGEISLDVLCTSTKLCSLLPSPLTFIHPSLATSSHCYHRHLLEHHQLSNISIVRWEVVRWLQSLSLPFMPFSSSDFNDGLVDPMSFIPFISSSCFVVMACTWLHERCSLHFVCWEYYKKQYLHLQFVLHKHRWVVSHLRTKLGAVVCLPHQLHFLHWLLQHLHWRDVGSSLC